MSASALTQRAISRAKSNVARGYSADHRLSVVHRNALARFETAVLSHLATRRPIPKTVIVLGHRLRVRVLAGGSMVLITNYFHDWPIIGVRPTPQLVRQSEMRS